MCVRSRMTVRNLEKLGRGPRETFLFNCHCSPRWAGTGRTYQSWTSCGCWNACGLTGALISPRVPSSRGCGRSTIFKWWKSSTSPSPRYAWERARHTHGHQLWYSLELGINDQTWSWGLVIAQRVFPSTTIPKCSFSEAPKPFCRCPC